MAKKRASETKLGQLHDLVATRLLEELKNPECPPAIFNAAIKFLKDNSIEAVMEDGSPLKALFEGMPEFEDD
jgi:hypothetical protein